VSRPKAELHGLRADVASPDPEVRRLAVERLDPLGDEASLGCLVDCLGDPSWRVRKAAVERLVELPEATGVARRLVAALADGENPGRRNAAVEVLVRSGAAAVPELLVATRSADVDVRKLVVDALAGIGDARAQERMIELLADPDPNVRAAAADALGAAEAPEATTALLRVARQQDEHASVRHAALRALARSEARLSLRELAPVLAEPALRPALYAALGQAEDEESVECLLKGLTASSRAAREAAMEAVTRVLARLDPSDGLLERIRSVASGCDELVQGAIERLETAELPGRLMLVQFLGLLEREDAALALLGAARDDALTDLALATLAATGDTAECALEAAWGSLDVEERALACRALGRTAGTRGERLLAEALHHADALVRTEAGRALGARPRPQPLPELVRALRNAPSRDELAAEEELAALTDAVVALAERAGADSPVVDETVGMLAECLDAAAEPVRRAVARVLGRLGRSRDAGAVALLLKDPSPEVRRAAVQALARLEPGSVAEPLRLALADESARVRIAAASALGEARLPSVAEDLERLTLDEDVHVRAAALRALGRQAARHAEPALRERALARLGVALGDEGGVALAAVEALAAIGGSVATGLVRPLLESPDPELVRAAVACVGAHADPAQIDDLVRLIAHPHWAVRVEAIRTLAARGHLRAVPSLLRRLETEQDHSVREVMLAALERLEG
jgi:HEAT repeat protein